MSVGDILSFERCPGHINSISRHFEEMKAIIDKIVKTNESRTRKTSKRARLTWPMKSNKAESLKSRLESLESSLMLLLKYSLLRRTGKQGK